MARQRKKICLYCYKPFIGRADAKTCSDRCRKGIQRARLLFERIESQPEAVKLTKRYATTAAARSYYAGR
jgi:hypothetical protein